jgi:hypothetical protein
MNGCSLCTCDDLCVVAAKIALNSLGYIMLN